MRIPLARTAAFVCIALALTAPTNAQTTTRVSVSSNGTQGAGFSAAPTISTDGRFSAFESNSNLSGGATNGWQQIYLHDRNNGATTRVSVDSAGVEGNQGSSRPALSSYTGRFVAFDSLASNLAAGDNNGTWDVFVRDTLLSTTARVSVDSIGTQGSGSSTSPSISADGRYVAFTSGSPNLVQLDTNLVDDIFVHDRVTGITTRVSVSSSGVQANGWCGAPAMSDDARYVAFESVATNIVSGDSNGFEDVFVHDRSNGTTVRVSVDSAGTQGNNDSYFAAVSGTGRVVTFSSNATNLVLGDTNNVADVFVRDLSTNATTRVSTSSLGLQSNGLSQRSRISSDALFVTFESAASNLVPGDTNGAVDIFARSLTTGGVERVSVSSAGAQGDAACVYSAISSNGRFVAFASYSTNLVSGDTNATPDIFVRDRGAPPGAYCTAGTSTNGCVPSIAGIGTPSASNSSDFTINVAWVEGQKFGIVFYGTNGQIASPWSLSSTSTLCVKAPLQRTPSQNSNGTANTCLGSLTLDWNAYTATHPNSLGVPFAAGQHVYAQAWYRDPPAPKTTNLSDALEFIVAP